VHVEASVGPGELVLCFWRCEETAPALEAALRELGLLAVCQSRGPCEHADERGVADPGSIRKAV
jgi:hypothetical protein